MHSVSSIVDGSIAVAGIIAGLLALVWCLKLSESTTEFQKEGACCEDHTTLHKAA
ncbi:MAG: hypothetical protein HY581_07895 [Nitrospirae bacterium]|nr:hypothetical protein [Nitrospirota bacterium]